ncbi:hypothetical protein IC789_11975 [Acinetobacter seifertii]|uniref:Uncharacterized protein n=1 Tax=Acinetobacter seifertii TaxID=1530123 RepID=A0A7H2VE70_9GAMM|nr:hypothetical protein [Acinetobacter seifertii]QNX18351.1 hypothetical protein IC792_11725 [Acinetobacter seifertii]QNX25024.1 hypothetical protein IC791_11775 [Acinetobacter seifertii]QNX35984.1 hypothetical protein IC789_11975 [Acinetobacter seifertii]QNX46649.1 hypothetical protein IC785_08405 [Acinetobacter seifertii]QNX53881.1 hypothetical protein IC783_08310 [Acinetobacter seifertii]
MENFLKILGVLIVPIIVVFLNNRLAKLKHEREIKAEFLKLAEEFENKEVERRSLLYKDRLAKSLFNHDALTYREAKFFAQYENADLWIKEFIKVRGRIKRIGDEEENISGLTTKHTKSKIFFSVLGYIFFTFIGLIPFVKFNTYRQQIISYFQEGMYLNVFLMISIFLICLVCGFLCLKYIEKSADSWFFLYTFKRDAFKLKKRDEHNSESYTTDVDL